ncbi:hypothetical protein JVU11DRAFT_5430 [Chiua virens]|nr:hypothetical protein JVU11DRAFT_5430 [Chiua virens]
MSRKHRHTAGANGRPGTQRSLHHRDCQFCSGNTTHCAFKEYTCRYMLSVLFHHIFMFRCNLALLRFTVTLTLISLPIWITRLLAFHQRRRPPPILAPSTEALVLSTFPTVWFYGFLYYTEIPSLVSVLLTVILATQHWHLSAAMVCIALLTCSDFALNLGS